MITRRSQGLKYVKLNFSNNHHANSGKLGASGRRSGGQPLTPGYIRHSGMADYFPGGMDSANTEAGLISNTGRTSKFAQVKESAVKM